MIMRKLNWCFLRFRSIISMQSTGLDIVLDPLCGTGTTVINYKELGVN
jgi:DNA modification methylase